MSSEGFHKICLLILLMNVKTFSSIYAECIVKSRNYYYFCTSNKNGFTTSI